MFGGSKLKIGMVVAPFSSGRGGWVELALEGLAKGLWERGHEVVLWTVPDPMASPQWASQVGLAARLLHQAMGVEGELGSCDIVHDHTVAGLFVRNLHHRAPLVATNYRPFDADPIPLYRRRPDDHVPLLAVSLDHGHRSPTSITVDDAIHPGIDLSPYPYRRRGSGYFVSVGRMHPTGGVIEAIQVARATDTPLLICSSVENPDDLDYFHAMVQPELGPDIQFTDDLHRLDRIDLLAAARGLIYAPSTHEPFALAIVEAMACGTPCLALDRGAAAEIVDSGRTGFVAATVSDLATGAGLIDDIDRSACRKRAERFFGCDEVARHHEQFYYEVMDRAAEGQLVGSQAMGLDDH